MKMVYFDMTLDKIRPNSNSKIIGSAKNICDNTSGGVRIAARINEQTYKYGRAFFILEISRTFSLTKKITMTGIWKAIVNAKIKFTRSSR